MPLTTISYRDVFLTVLFWLAISATLTSIYFTSGAADMVVQETDDAMRLVMVEDLLQGAPWQNQGEPRDNTPYGGQMHWSALVGLPLARLAAVTGPRLAVVVWPLMLLLPLMLLTLAAARQLAPLVAPAVVAVLAIFNVILLAEFSPGRIDHHNVQIVLLQAVLLVMLSSRQKAWGGALTGVLLASCIAVGIETLPIVLGVGLAYALCWLMEPLAYRRGLFGFAAGLAVGMVAHLLFASPVSQLLFPYCDANSVVYVMAACLSAAALALAALATSSRPFWVRFVTLSSLGALAVVATAARFPECMAGPYAGVDPRMLVEVFPQIPEVQPFWTRMLASPQTVIPFGASALVALGVVVWQTYRRTGHERTNWIIVLCMLGAACAVMLLQIRGARLGAALALPVAAWAITELRQRSGVGAAAALLASWLTFATWVQAYAFAALSLLVSSPAGAVAAEAGMEQCMRSSSFAGLAAMPVSGVAAPYLLGPFVLLHTPHSVLSAGFHRNGTSTSDAIDFFDDESRAREIAKKRGLELAVACVSQPEVVAALDRRSWLEPLPSSGPLKIYRIRLGS